MPEPTIGAKLTLDARDFNDKLAASQKKAEGFVGGIQASFGRLASGNLLGAGQLFSTFTSGLSSLATPMGAIGALTSAVGGLVEQYLRMAEAGATAATAQGRFARRFEMDTTAVGALQLVAARANVSTEQLDLSMGHFMRQLEAARNGSREAAEAFAVFGITGSQLDHPGQVLATMVANMNRLNGTAREHNVATIVGARNAAGFERMGLIAERGGGLGAIGAEGVAGGSIAGPERVRAVEQINRERREVEERTAELRLRNENAAAENGARVRLVEAHLDRAIAEAGGGAWGWLTANLATGEGENRRPQGVRTDSARMTPEQMTAAGLTPEVTPVGGVAFNAAHREELNQTLGTVGALNTHWSDVQARLMEHVNTLGMAAHEVQLYRLEQERAELAVRLQSAAMQQMTAEERQRLGAVQLELDMAAAMVGYAQGAAETERQRQWDQSIAERMQEAAGHRWTRTGRAEAALGTLQATEQHFGFNQTPRMAHAVTERSAAAINQINASAMENQAGNVSIADRIERAQAANLVEQRLMRRDVQEMTEILRATQSRPATVN